ncbi:MAG: F0F1 ATP synthase subunit A [bacterium]|nr:F0F1 ATP synthase subunit A [bacterium]
MLASFLKTFAKSDIHVSLKAEKLFDIGPLTVTNSMLYGLVISILVGVVMIASSKRIRINARKGWASIVEILIEFVVDLCEGVFGSRKKAVKFAPFFAVFFIFILFNNLAGVLPFVGASVTIGETPLFRPFTADLNGTIAMAVFAILLVQYLSIREQGGLGHLEHYFSDKPLNPINFFIGILEVFGEFTRIMSLSLRLFLNTAVGEILIAVFASIILSSGRTPLSIIPIILFEALVAGIQAYVFTVLSATYLGLAIAHSDEHEDEHHEEITAKVEAAKA